MIPRNLGEERALLPSPDYIQHSAHIEPDRDDPFNLFKSSPATLKYEPGLIVADGDFVIVHGRFSGSVGRRAGSRRTSSALWMEFSSNTGRHGAESQIPT